MRCGGEGVQKFSLLVFTAVESDEAFSLPTAAIRETY